jgi:hypothetical protein
MYSFAIFSTIYFCKIDGKKCKKGKILALCTIQFDLGLQDMVVGKKNYEGVRVLSWTENKDPDNISFK